jgi:hypothetical protein
VRVSESEYVCVGCVDHVDGQAKGARRGRGRESVCVLTLTLTMSVARSRRLTPTRASPRQNR